MRAESSTHNLMNVFARALKRERQARGITQAELAGRIGRTQPEVSRYERGVCAPSLRRLQAMAAAIGCEPADLMREGDE